MEPEGFGPRDPIWDAAPWLKGLRRVPKDATWPRLMTAPHPQATGIVWAAVREVGAAVDG